MPTDVDRMNSLALTKARGQEAALVDELSKIRLRLAALRQHRRLDEPDKTTARLLEERGQLVLDALNAIRRSLITLNARSNGNASRT